MNPAAVTFVNDGEFHRVANRPLEGKPVMIIGGGPGLTREVAAQALLYNVILTNNAYLLIEEPRLVVAMDRRWYGWHAQAAHQLGHTMVAGLRPGQHAQTQLPYIKMQKDSDGLLTDDPGLLTGKNSGQAAIILARHLGASRIYLAGFDMTFRGETKEVSHWHSGHVIPSSLSNYETRFRPRLEKLTRALLREGRTLAAVTPSEADIPHVPLTSAIEDLARAQNRVDNAAAPASLSE